MPRLTKAIISKYGISKKAWVVARGAHARSSGKSSMTKPRRRFPRLRRYGRRLKGRFSKAKVPFEVLIGAATVPFTPAQSGCMTPMEALQQGNMVELVGQLKSGFLGYDIFNIDKGPDIMRMLNPFDMERGRYTKTLIYAGLIGMVRRKITGRYTNGLFKKIPLIGRWVS